MDVVVYPALKYPYIPIDVINIRKNVANVIYVFIHKLMSFHFCLRNVAVISLPISRALPIIIIDMPPPTNSSFKPTMLKYAPHADIAIALNNTEYAKKFMLYI